MMRTLADLALAINQAHERCENGMRASLAAALEAGDLLIEAREKVRAVQGHWHNWLRSNVRPSVDMCQRYVRVAEHRDRLEEMAERGRHLLFGDSLSLRQALRLLTDDGDAEADDLPDVDDPNYARLLAEAAEAARLEAANRRTREITADEAAKLERKLLTLGRIARWLRRINHLRTAELIEAAMAAEQEPLTAAAS